DEKSFNRILRRISHEIIERNKGAEGIIFLGILTRGYPLSERISKNIYDFEGIKAPCYHLDISNYRDDRRMNKNSKPTDCNIDINDKKIIIVDDVISTGRTVRAAMDAINAIGRPSKIELVAIVDRGHRELPIKPDFIGKNIPTSKDEFVVVEIEEIDGHDMISIEDRKV
ncbi:MAG: bifunctional pyr operon transcriptional regulator/uracil phosphoribosyltransferase PyrR, partial [Tissierellia bacterium]|nr:bifunctional pyr operon transcriptional regulator/uracil phosphoribosyltransferase PyrR [Tissierellia bacterium]